MGLPTILENLMQTIMDSGTLQTWNIFKDKNGYVNINLKFSDHHGPVEHTSYRRRTKKEIDRGQQRTRQWRETQAKSQQCVGSIAASSKCVNTQTDHPSVLLLPNMIILECKQGPWQDKLRKF